METLTSKHCLWPTFDSQRTTLRFTYTHSTGVLSWLYLSMLPVYRQKPCMYKVLMPSIITSISNVAAYGDNGHIFLCVSGWLSAKSQCLGHHLCRRNNLEKNCLKFTQ